MKTLQTIRDLLARHRWVGPLVALAIVFSVFAAMLPGFTQPINLITMARQTAVVGIAATGATLVIISGGIDLSVGSSVALTTVVVSLLLKSGQGPWTAIPLAIVAAGATGAANGALIAGLRLKPFIVTLGTMSILRGVAKGLAKEQKVDVDARGIDSLVLSSEGLLGLPLAVWIFALTGLVIAGVLHFTRFGRHVFAIGSNERTAVLAGIRVPLTKVAIYGLAGVLAGLAGTLEFATLTVGDPTDSFGLELDVIASCVIGGASLSGGEGSIAGTIVGALLMRVIQTGCTQLGLASFIQNIVTGAIIIAAARLAADRKRRA
ncbi:MAG: ABC transporter permease [Polyangiaceae bacterium]